MTMRHPSACLRCVQRPLAVFAATTLAIGLAVEAAVLCAAAAYSCGIFGFAGGVASSMQGPAHLATRALHHGERGWEGGGLGGGEAPLGLRKGDILVMLLPPRLPQACA